MVNVFVWSPLTLSLHSGLTERTVLQNAALETAYNEWARFGGITREFRLTFFSGIPHRFSSHFLSNQTLCRIWNIPLPTLLDAEARYVLLWTRISVEITSTHSIVTVCLSMDFIRILSNLFSYLEDIKYWKACFCFNMHNFFYAFHPSTNFVIKDLEKSGPCFNLVCAI